MAMTAAERKAKSREKKGTMLQVNIEFNEDEILLVTETYNQQIRYGVKQDFYKASLLTGMKFISQQRGGKK